ncbi:MAG: division/cell wall cluster transcriptional repressor MraZ [Lachnospiraceae bacterium]|nr:division/cell wall cluster transcriptional repressor MraZ [Lachnospiraceae bacterium]
MFMGTYSHTLDDKGRLIIPSKFREALGEDFVLTQDLDHCLSIYPQNGWKTLTASLETMPRISSELARRLRRFYFGNSSTCEPDKQGRMLIPANLRDYAGLTKEVTLVGVDDHIEVWNTETWNAYNGSIDINDLEADLKNLDL